MLSRRIDEKTVGEKWGWEGIHDHAEKMCIHTLASEVEVPAFMVQKLEYLVVPDFNDAMEMELSQLRQVHQRRISHAKFYRNYNKLAELLANAVPAPANWE